MAIIPINIGTTANDGTGDSIREAFNKCNNNFTELSVGDHYKGTWLVTRFMHNNAIQPYLLGSAVNGGNVNNGITSNALDFRTMGGVLFSSGTSANGGYRYTTPYGSMASLQGLSAYGTFYLANNTRDNFIQLGFVSSQLGGASINKACITINTATATLVTQNDDAVGDPSTVSAGVVLSIGVNYTFLVEFVTTTSVRARIKETISGTVVFDETNTTNAPATNQRFGAHALATIVTAGTSASVIGLSEFSFGVKPNFLNDF